MISILFYARVFPVLLVHFSGAGQLPDKNSKILEKLPIGWKVEILKREGKKDKIGELQGEWVFIDTNIGDKGLRDTIKGWVFDYYLADLKDFKKVTSFIECVVEGWLGECLISYRFKKDGTYLRNAVNPETGKTIKNIKGRVYRYRDVIAAQDEKEGMLDFFYFTPDRVLCSISKDELGNPICCKEKNK